MAATGPGRSACEVTPFLAPPRCYRNLGDYLHTMPTGYKPVATVLHTPSSTPRPPQPTYYTADPPGPTTFFPHNPACQFLPCRTATSTVLSNAPLSGSRRRTLSGCTIPSSAPLLHLPPGRPPRHLLHIARPHRRRRQCLSSRHSATPYPCSARHIFRPRVFAPQAHVRIRALRARLPNGLYTNPVHGDRACRSL